ncbi:MAG: hypothetical protein KME42_12320 [Tildeniella nuda ZEHNDER 1965/U140]|nr:hypothetical protein [Tildeniella nuda ZEHNDER 1965/U140]
MSGSSEARNPVSGYNLDGNDIFSLRNPVSETPIQSCCVAKRDAEVGDLALEALTLVVESLKHQSLDGTRTAVLTQPWSTVRRSLFIEVDRHYVESGRSDRAVALSLTIEP